MSRHALLVAIVCTCASLPAPCAQDSAKGCVAFALGVNAGVDVSHIEADSTMSVFFAPLGGVRDLVWPSFGLYSELDVGRVFGVSLGLTYNRRGQYLAKTQAQFRDDPFVHDLETRTLLTYLSLPLVLKAGYRFPHQWLQVRAGIVPALLVADSLVWFVDGAPSTESGSAPTLTPERIDIRLLAGVEYGYRFGRNGVYCGLDYEYGVRTVAYDLPGEAFTRAFSVFVGYRRFLFGQ
jgi:hypothetical protein